GHRRGARCRRAAVQRRPHPAAALRALAAAGLMSRRVWPRTPVPLCPGWADLMRRRVRPGRPFPLGPDWHGEGTNFSLFSENADRVELCLFHEDGAEERIEVPERTAFCWHCYLPGIGPGQHYGYRVHGPYDPAAGRRFNPAKLLIDPYAKQIEGVSRWVAANTLPYVPSTDPDADFTIDESDSAPAVPKSVVIDP